jgi:hypothetical protein
MHFPGRLKITGRLPTSKFHNFALISVSLTGKEHRNLAFSDQPSPGEFWKNS